MHAPLLADFQRITPTLKVIADTERLKPFETDAFISHRALPLCAVLPESEAQVVEILKACNARGVPLVTRGAGTGISGGAIPLENGVLAVLSRMKQILAVDPAARTARVQPGVANAAVTKAAAPFGLFYAPDPSSQIVCSIGGNVAENAGGVHCLKYGLTVHNVLRIRVVALNGDILEIGSAALDAPGYDLLALMHGSEGLLGLITEVTVKLTPEPEYIETLLAAFPSVTDAANAVNSIIGAGVIPAALEMMDKMVINACEKFMSAGFPLDAEALLLIELDGAPEEVAEYLATVEAILRASHAQEIRRACDDTEREKLWKSRKGAFAALATICPDYYTMDGTIPRRCLPEVLARYAQLGAEFGMMIANVFHAGDGNLHPVIFYDAAKPGEMARSEELGGKLLEICIEVGGTITGEHGVGIEKLKQMCVQFRESELAMFHVIKAVFDPEGLLNPGRAVPELKRCSEWGGMHVRGGEIPRADMPRF
ncbi:MAG: FAD-binding protein [Burkholderiales bacterium]|nr:FAD-binding protein [Burkholderiales bacterium]